MALLCVLPIPVSCQSQCLCQQFILGTHRDGRDSITELVKIAGAVAVAVYHKGSGILNADEPDIYSSYTNA